MPDSMSSCGLFTAPPASMTSRSARAVSSAPPAQVVDAAARPPSITILVTRASVCTVRFGRSERGLR